MRKLIGGFLALMVGMGLACNTATSTKPAAPPTKPASASTGAPGSNNITITNSTVKDSTITTASAANAGAGVISPANTKIAWLGTKGGPRPGKHNGDFQKFGGKIDPPGSDLTASKITVDIETASITSDVGKLTTHLKSPDFFNVDNHPKATFASTKIEAAKEGEATHKITGDLTILGKTKSITFPAKIAVTDDAIKLDSKFTINRQDYGMKYGTGQIDNDVSLTISVNASRK